MCHVTEEPWQLIVYPSRNANMERNHDAVMSITFVEHNQMLDPVEDCEGVDDQLTDTLTQIAADRIIQIAAAALEDVIIKQHTKTNDQQQYLQDTIHLLHDMAPNEIFPRLPWH